MKTSGGLRYRLCALCNEMHEVANWPDNHVQPLAAPHVINDSMPPTQSMANGKVFESKSGIRKTYLPSGNPDGKHYTEVGNDEARHKPKPKYRPDRRAIRTSIERAEARLSRGDVTEATKRILLSRPGPA